MTTTGLLYVLLAAYLAGISSALWLFSLLVRGGENGGHPTGCFIRSGAGMLLILAAYLFFIGLQILGSTGLLLY